METQVEEESSSDEPEPGEREGGGEAAPFTITNEDDIEFAIEELKMTKNSTKRRSLLVIDQVGIP